MAVCCALLLTALAIASLALGSARTDAEKLVEEDTLDLLVKPVPDYHNTSSLSGTADVCCLGYITGVSPTLFISHSDISSQVL